MADQSNTQQDKPIEKEIGHLKPSASIIVYPSLTAPALAQLNMKGTYKLDLIIAGDEILRDYFTKKCGGTLTPGSQASVEFLRYCHSHLSLISWRSPGKEHEKKEDVYTTSEEPHGVEPHDEKSKYDAVPTGDVWLAYCKDLASTRNMLYSTMQHDGPGHYAEQGQCSGWFLHEIPEVAGSHFVLRAPLLVSPIKSVQNTIPPTLINLCANPQTPLGTLSTEALTAYYNAGLRWLFHLRFEAIENTHSGPMAELIWNCARFHDESSESKNTCHYNPIEELILPLFTNEFVQGGEKAGHAQQLLKPLDAPQEEESPLHELGEKKRRENLYILRDIGKPFLTPELKRKQPDSDAYVCALTQSGSLYLPRHPVYIAPFDKKKLNIGIISDSHVSSRQALYKLVGARVIPGVDQFDEGMSPSAEESRHHIAYPSSADSPLIGPMCHENLQSLQYLMEKTKGTSDIIFYLGDMYDHIRNCDPQYYIERSQEKKNITANLWSYLEYSKHVGKRDMYPRFIDASVTLNLIYDCYSDGKPLVFIAGNHEPYEHAYGISPRVLPSLFNKKGNPGIPADHNLTFYEAMLLYGEDYGFTPPRNTEGDTQRDIIGNFQKDNFLWIRLFMSPWQDLYLEYAQEQAMLFLDWGKDEAFLPNSSRGYDDLPVASSALTSDQITLLDHLCAKKTSTPEVTTILAAHFTSLAYTRDLATINDDYDKKGIKWIESSKTRDAGQEDGINIYRQDPDRGAYTTIGTYQEPGGLVRHALQNGDIDYMMSGHTHRAGIYEFTEEGYSKTVNAPGIFEMRDKVSLAQRAHKERGGVMLVAGSCGTYNKRNMYREFGAFGMDEPQSMILDLTQGDHTVFMPRIEQLKPRLAVVLDYLWEDGKFLFETLWIKETNVEDPGEERRVKWLGYHFITKGKNMFYHAKLNPNVLRYFSEQRGGPFPQECPVKEIKIHAVSPKGEHGGCLLLRPAQYHPETGEIIFHTRAENSGYYLTTWVKKNNQSKDAPLFYMSMTFQGKGEWSQQYNITSPWCFPARYVEVPGYNRPTYYFRCGLSDEEKGTFMPDYILLNNIKEYAANK